MIFRPNKKSNHRWEFGASMLNAFYNPENNQICKKFYELF